LEELERAFVANGQRINNLLAENTQLKSTVQHYQHYQHYTHALEMRTEQQRLPSIPHAMARVPLPGEHFLLPSTGGWGVQYGTIDPQQVNSAGAFLTQEDRVSFGEDFGDFSSEELMR